MNELIDLMSFILSAEWAEWKCHLAFVGPIDNVSWSNTAIDKFIAYTNQFEKLAITIPISINSCAQSTPVILWVSCDRDAIKIDALEAEYDTWQNVNLKMIFQGLARSNVHIAYLSPERLMPWQTDDMKQLQNGTNRERKKVQRWSPAPPVPSKEFKCKPFLVMCSTLTS